MAYEGRKETLNNPAFYLPSTFFEWVGLLGRLDPITRKVAIWRMLLKLQDLNIMVLALRRNLSNLSNKACSHTRCCNNLLIVMMGRLELRTLYQHSNQTPKSFQHPYCTNLFSLSFQIQLCTSCHGNKAPLGWDEKGPGFSLCGLGTVFVDWMVGTQSNMISEFFCSQWPFLWLMKPENKKPWTTLQLYYPSIFLMSRTRRAPW